MPPTCLILPGLGFHNLRHHRACGMSAQISHRGSGVVYGTKYDPNEVPAAGYSSAGMETNGRPVGPLPRTPNLPNSPSDDASDDKE
jgi:hypothetical protein